eukprot:gene14124-biopygen11706
MDGTHRGFAYIGRSDSPQVSPRVPALRDVERPGRRPGAVRRRDVARDGVARFGGGVRGEQLRRAADAHPA